MSPITEPKKKYSRTVKCPICQQQLDRNTEPFIEKSGRFLHEACNQQQLTRTQPRRDLIEYICELQNIKAPTGYILKQIKDFEENHGFTIQGIHMTLKYFHEIEKNEVVEGTGIGIVEYVYKNARDHYSKMAQITGKASEFPFDKNESTIYSRPRKTENRKKYIDIEELLNE